jgi:hypothetical protein
VSKASSPTPEAGLAVQLREPDGIAEFGAGPVRRGDEGDSAVRYGRSRFLKDAAWMGLDQEQAFSKALLKQRRDQLMSVHHPDRGGSPDMARDINATYSRMLRWLQRRSDRRERARGRQQRNAEQATGERPWRSPLSAAFRTRARQAYAAAVIAVIGYAAFFRNRR